MFSNQEIEILSVLEVSDYCFELAKEVGTRNAEYGIYGAIEAGEGLGAARELALLFKEGEEYWLARLSPLRAANA
jgi:hypothetical protein